MEAPNCPAVARDCVGLPTGAKVVYLDAARFVEPAVDGALEKLAELRARLRGLSRDYGGTQLGKALVELADLAWDAVRGLAELQGAKLLASSDLLCESRRIIDEAVDAFNACMRRLGLESRGSA